MQHVAVIDPATGTRRRNKKQTHIFLKKIEKRRRKRVLNHQLLGTVPTVDYTVMRQVTRKGDKRHGKAIRTRARERQKKAKTRGKGGHNEVGEEGMQ